MQAGKGGEKAAQRISLSPGMASRAIMAATRVSPFFCNRPTLSPSDTILSLTTHHPTLSPHPHSHHPHSHHPLPHSHHPHSHHPLSPTLRPPTRSVAGSEDGTLQLWDVVLMSASGSHVGGITPAPDGLYPPWGSEQAFRGTPINGLAVAQWDEAASGEVHIAMAMDDGAVVLVDAK
jgi:hypothetical protein